MHLNYPTKNYLDIADSDQYSLKKQINLADNYQLPYVWACDILNIYYCAPKG